MDGLTIGFLNPLTISSSISAVPQKAKVESGTTPILAKPRTQNMSESMDGLLAVAEDERRDQISLQKYINMDGRPEGITQEDLICRASIKEVVTLLVKKPSFKRLLVDGFGLHVDYARDIVPLVMDYKSYPKQWKISQCGNSVATADDWKQEGNEAIQKKNRRFASNPSPEEYDDIRQNRALAYLRDKSFEVAL
ncbi:hypothetical protein HYALB_00006325 [Hymenoscyphus albidus]|uniref:Uncharacterized protein n=1 Tax=Hymenoscyphus albidus TaxID=595503 RepID=A0A9N9LII2_9HELO|nr:hypothetical protein HYALB_00006325 [Hymenoscyphus albidus]